MIQQPIKVILTGLILLVGLTSFLAKKKVEYKYNVVANYYIKNKIQVAKGIWIKLNKTQNTFILRNNSDLNEYASDTFFYILKNRDIFINDTKQYSSQIGDTCQCQVDFEYEKGVLTNNQCIVTDYVENYNYTGIKTSYYELKQNISMSHYARIRIVFDNLNEIPVYYDKEVFRISGKPEIRITYYLTP